ncbi:MAG: hypothetical protein OSB19_11555, partial [Opitutaceae bacterium]|nr:hypothetical protein [Opitutaceae bacterium]
MKTKTIIVAAIAVSIMSIGFAQEKELPPEVPDTFDLEIAKGFALTNNFAIRRAIEQIEELCTRAEGMAGA